MTQSGSGELKLTYDRGSLVLGEAAPEMARHLPEFMRWDGRISAFRCLALHYRPLVRHLVRTDQAYADHARNYPELELHARPAGPPYPHQTEAIAAWRRGKRGQVELPTGSGKTRVALMALHEVQRGALILVPTLDLVSQWCAVLEQDLGLEAGVVGGGSFQVAPVTVCTYASAYRHGEKFGDRFGLAIFDECHHLAGRGFSHIGEVLTAPYRLGLSATLERPDMRHHVLTQLIGPVVYRKAIGELSGKYLADYRVQTLYADLSAEERRNYDQARENYLGFARARGITLGSPRKWQQFVFAACRSPEGREALAAYYRQKRIAFSAEEKFSLCAELLHRHRGQRVLIFTNDNRTAYDISTRFLLPLITHQTRIAERREILANFRGNRWPTVVTSKVLNEGVDVPSASVAVIVSGNSSVREHVQRLGRILRKDGAKQAVLYELLTRHTMEEGTSRRRRKHDAYR
ncbi:MAG: DEAD/DEAH box helicase family protein [SAR324 cluster bacterium]|nr:DEAD/DEAH box helicase family protein [SAR324 cluster bacterium]MCZ6645895.1 DEAD/DEAH box helicase family protein [SAR324 cluster bacterium]